MDLKTQITSSKGEKEPFTEINYLLLCIGIALPLLYLLRELIFQMLEFIKVEPHVNIFFIVLNVVDLQCCDNFCCTINRLLFFFLLGPHLWHMEGPRIGAELELQLPAYTPATGTWDLSHVCDSHHSSQQCRILNPLSKTRN